MKNPLWADFVRTVLLLIGLVPALLGAHEPPPPPPQEPQKQKYSLVNDYLVIGTIFDPKGYAFPGLELRIRRSTEKKYRWDSYTNSRGEFAVRVPQGTDYEMVIHAKGFADQTRALDAKTGANEERMVFRLELAAGEKK